MLGTLIQLPGQYFLRQLPALVAAQHRCNGGGCLKNVQFVGTGMGAAIGRLVETVIDDVRNR